MSFLSKLIPRFNAIPIRISAFWVLLLFLVELDWLSLRLLWRCKGTRIVKTTLKKKSKVEGFTLPNFKTYYKTMWYLQMYILQRDQLNIIVQKQAYICLVIDFQQKCQGNFIRKRYLFSTDTAEIARHSYAKTWTMILTSVCPKIDHRPQHRNQDYKTSRRK